MKDLFEDIKIIDTDTHWCEPLDIWTSRAPKKYRDLVPQVREDEKGQKGWMFQGARIFPVGALGSGSYVDRDGFKMPDSAWKSLAEKGSFGSIAESALDDDQLDMMRNTPPLELVHQASWDPVARLELMDAQKIWAAISYPNLLLFAMGHFVRCQDRDLANACISMYNDASAEFQAAGKDRLFPMAVLPIWDVAESVKEAERAKGLGFRGVVMPGEPQSGGLQAPDEPEWEPLYEALSDLELPINIHIGANVVSDIYDEMGTGGAAGPRWKRSTQADPRSSRAGAQLFGNNVAFLINLLTSDLPLRYPKLRWVSVESGIGWIPHMLESIDFLYREEFVGYPDYPAPLVPDAHEMFRRSAYACFWFETSGPKYLLEEIGVDNVLWETDFPHSTARYPDPVEKAAEDLKDVPHEHLKKILQDNAANLYKIPV